jgi:hypothetical protein
MLGGLRRGKAAPHILPRKGVGTMPTIKKISLIIIVGALAIPALAGLAIQFNDPLPGVFYSQSMGATELGVIMCALAIAAFWPSSPSTPPIASDEEEE